MKAHAERINEFITRNRDLQNGIRELMCNTDVVGISSIALKCIKAIDNDEKGSASDECKVKSLKGRWFSKHEHDSIEKHPKHEVEIKEKY